MQRTPMFPRTRTGMKILMVTLIAACAAISAISYSSWSEDQDMQKSHDYPRFDTHPPEKLIDGLAVQGSIDKAYDIYAEEYETNMQGARTSNSSAALYYVVPVYKAGNDGSAHIDYLITYKAFPEDYGTMDKIFGHTWSDSAQAPSHTELLVENARIMNLPTEVRQHFTAWAEDPEFYEGGSFIDWCSENNIFGTDDKESIRSRLVPYMIGRTIPSKTDPAGIWVFLGLAALFTAFLLVLIFNKKPIKGVIDPHNKDDDFRRVREMSEK